MLADNGKASGGAYPRGFFVLSLFIRYAGTIVVLTSSKSANCEQIASKIFSGRVRFALIRCRVSLKRSGLRKGEGL